MGNVLFQVSLTLISNKSENTIFTHSFTVKNLILLEYYLFLEYNYIYVYIYMYIYIYITNKIDIYLYI